MYKLVSDQRVFMNTVIEFIAWTELDREEVHEVFSRGFQRFHYVVNTFSRFKPDSELSLLNKSDGSKMKVSQEFLKLVRFALELARKTDGVYDPTIIDFLEVYGYDVKYDFSKLENKDLIKKEIQEILKSRVSYNDIQLDSRNCTIRLAAKQRLDLGGIGKGYAIDLAFEELRPLQNFLINAGGDIRAKGIYKDGRSWLVGLKVPRVGQIGSTCLLDKAICCSGSWARRLKFFHHLINPKTGKPQNKTQVVFVIAPTAIEADGWATGLFVLSEMAIQVAEKFQLKVMVVDKQNKIQTYDFDYFNNRTL